MPGGALKLPTGEAGGPYTAGPSATANRFVPTMSSWARCGSARDTVQHGDARERIHVPTRRRGGRCHRRCGHVPRHSDVHCPQGLVQDALDDCDAAWQTATPASVGQFSAVGYFFFGRRMLYKALGIPVGLITSNWGGGSTIEAWMTVEAIDATPGIDHAVAKSGTYDNSIPPAALQRNDPARLPLYGQRVHLVPGRVEPQELVRLQGIAGSRSSNSGGKPGGDGKMPFYYTQLAPYRYEGDELRSLPLVIEAQYRALAEIPHSGIAATTDLGNRPASIRRASAKGRAAGVPRPGERLRGDGAARPGAGIQVDGARRQ